MFGTMISDPGLGTKRGALATEICVNESEIVLKPEMIDMTHAATMGVASLTVGGAFRKIELNSKDVVVIQLQQEVLEVLQYSMQLLRGRQ